jgi:hypothetical protein
MLQIFITYDKNLHKIYANNNFFMILCMMKLMKCHKFVIAKKKTKNFRTKHATIIGVIHGSMEYVRYISITQVGSIIMRESKMLLEDRRERIQSPEIELRSINCMYECIFYISVRL